MGMPSESRACLNTGSYCISRAIERVVVKQLFVLNHFKAVTKFWFGPFIFFPPFSLLLQKLIVCSKLQN